jgi:hypothetical protein
VKLLSFHAADGVRLGVKTDAGVVDVREAATGAGLLDVPDSVEEVIAGGPSALEQVARVAEAADATTSE